jgi:hypothetical protein
MLATNIKLSASDWEGPKKEMIVYTAAPAPKLSTILNRSTMWILRLKAMQIIKGILVIRGNVFRSSQAVMPGNTH